MGLKNANALVAAILAAAASMGKHGGARGSVQVIGPALKAPTRTRVFRTWRSSAPQIKQGARECARRQGGQVWAEFKAADRLRRGIFDAQELERRHRLWLQSKDWIRREVMGGQQ